MITTINAISLAQGNIDFLCTEPLISLYLVLKNSAPTKKKLSKRIKNQKKSVEINFDHLILFSVISKWFELAESAWWHIKAQTF